ncbi:hypothetical protein [Paenibacillus tepidiphilus]|uniref:hypothetical protein n=1 Tax=Paenibacillus tepidiphilus TaxID=2608683 RepID=UPI0012385D49|nr:hypothetical protein [Paenibacillus tepidiphilus]
MVKAMLTFDQKKSNVDLWIIITATFVALGIYSGFQGELNTFAKDQDASVLLRTLVSALTQFAVAGLGITLVAIIRKESFISFGLRSKGIVASVLLSLLCFVPYIAFTVATEEGVTYQPFQSVWITEDILADGFLVNVLGMVLVAGAWGFFEGFNYVVISDKINRRYPSPNRWLNWGAIICAVMCILIHGMIGVTAKGALEMITVLLGIYGMLLVKDYTRNAWGSVFLFVFVWNAL